MWVDRVRNTRAKLVIFHPPSRISEWREEFPIFFFQNSEFHFIYIRVWTFFVKLSFRNAWSKPGVRVHTPLIPELRDTGINNCEFKASLNIIRDCLNNVEKQPIFSRLVCRPFLEQHWLHMAPLTQSQNAIMPPGFARCVLLIMMTSYYWFHCCRVEGNIWALWGTIELSLK